ncbi:TIGR04283 family arsenosugar biosynthesis glycosyltransferase [Thioalkalivibrio sp.]|uniref:TIGR04283 family arsenosugar biosynthesis glycosyltransferase n=1 Tax=Thioalkalivibrio sp. TaxID=2093813 RepID=UPI0039749644
MVPAGSPVPESGPGRPEPMLSVVIPCLNEEDGLPRLLRDLQTLRSRGHEVIVVDGGSEDSSAALAAAGADRVLRTAPGRALQMNAGAARARGSALWFLHADSRIDEPVALAVISALAQGRAWGRCAVRLSGDGLLLALTARLMNLRSCLTGIATGDQGVFVMRSAFDAVGGFPAIPLMEDIEMSRRLKRRAGRPACVRSSLVTSSRRWEQRGVVRTILLMWRLRLAYWRGADPARLAERYR